MSEFVNKEKDRLYRCLEMLPGSLSWGIILGLVLLSMTAPVACAVFIITFDFYWIIRTLYLTTLLLIAHRKLFRQKNKDWLKRSERLKGFEKIYHLIIFPVYREGLDILRPSIEALKATRFPADKMIVVVSFEERHKPSLASASKSRRWKKSSSPPSPVL